jgi:hypothetical protein
MRTLLSKVAKSLAVAAVVALGVTSGRLSSANAAMQKSIPPNPNFMTPAMCGYGGSGPNDTATCNAAIVRALDNARATLGMGGLPGNFSPGGFDALSAPEQIFAIADIERTARGLPPIAGLTAQLNAVALSGAQRSQDPSTNLPLPLSGGGQATDYGSNFAEGTANAMGANYFWMYDDGPGSPNADCTPSNQSGCWGHRDNILGDYTSNCSAGSEVNAVMGAAEVTSGVAYEPGIAEIFTNDCGPLAAMDFTWGDVQRQVFGLAPSPPPVAPTPPPVAASPPPVAASPPPASAHPSSGATTPTPSASGTRHRAAPRARDPRVSWWDSGTVAGSVKARS